MAEAAVGLRQIQIWSPRASSHRGHRRPRGRGLWRRAGHLMAGAPHRLRGGEGGQAVSVATSTRVQQTRGATARPRSDKSETLSDNTPSNNDIPAEPSEQQKAKHDEVLRQQAGKRRVVYDWRSLQHDIQKIKLK